MSMAFLKRRSCSLRAKESDSNRTRNAGRDLILFGRWGYHANQRD